MATLSSLGAMRHSINVQEYTETTNPQTGVRTRSWSDKYTDVPAAYRALTSREQQGASARNSEVSVEFEMHAGLAITAANRIVFEGDVYEIEPPTLDETRQRRMKIKAARGMTDG